jgi:hypothetical protein
MIIHKQVEIELNEEKIKIDEKLVNIILKLNRCGCNTIYSCQGDKYNEGYVKFDKNTDMELAYNILNALLPYHVLRLDFHNIIRFARTKQAYINRYNAVKMFKNKTRKLNKESILK